MATVNAAREEFEAAKTAALRAAGKVPKEAVIRVFVILLDILIVVLLEKTTRKTSRNSGLPPSQTDKDESVPGATARARSRTGRWATTCVRPSSKRRSRSMPATPAAPTSTAPSIGSAARHRVRGRRAPRRDQGMPEVQGPVPRQHPVQYGIGIQALVSPQPAGRPDAVPAPCRRVRAGDLRHQALRGLGYAFTMRHGRRPPWRTSCNAQPCMSTRPDFGSTASGFMSWDPDVQVPAPQARPGGKRSASSRATRAS